MRLYVGVLGCKKLLRPVAREILNHIGEFATAIIAFPGITLGVLIGKDGTGSIENGFADEVFGGNQFEAFVLAACLVVNGHGDFGIGFVQRSRHRIVFHKDPFPETLAYTSRWRIS